MNEAEGLRSLDQLPLFHYLPDMPTDTRRRIAGLFFRVSHATQLAPGEVLLRQGGLGGDVGFILVEGAVHIERDSESPMRLEGPALLGEMYQLNPHAQRTATVRADGAATVLQFSWQEFYSRVKDALTPEERMMLVECIEHCVLERFDRELLLDLPLFRGLPDELKLRCCLMLQWESERLVLNDGDVLFKEKGMCGDMGYLLIHGAVEIVPADHPPRSVEAPNMIGILPEFNPELRWTATARAQGRAELQRFPWLAFVRGLQTRLRPEEQQHFLSTVRANMPGHFIR